MKIFGVAFKDTEIIVTIFNKNFIIHKTNKIYRLIFSRWTESGASDEVIAELKSLYSNADFWNNSNKELWLIYICCLLQRKDSKAALEVLNKYNKLFKTACIEHYLPAAKLAYENGIISEDIKLAAKLFDEFELAKNNNWLSLCPPPSFKNEFQNDFKNSSKTKSIAIVGNGSGLIGSGKGKEIDSHDIVIRFNKFRTQGFEQDCGEKLDIWVTQTTPKEEFDVNNVETIVLSYPYLYWNARIDLQYLKSIIKDNKNVQFLTTDDLKFARECLKNNSYRPTTGCILILALYRHLKSFDNIDFYGFGFLNEEFTPLDHYYQKVSKRHQEKAQAMHNFKEESYFLKQLIQQKSFTK